ncbi:fumarylacetoacetate hydrolase family protein [Geomicrobium sediminis]|uniref:2-keto-4-pentenoate hydratase/2-oxohepta-3-ene-1,7-dioic acid hydratase in catechol pathway n=1 Tax=Geomicrobium sediminis TaxID=1347788 RepID=A0ABS2PCZ2_9BACL|nr:fumarylacetoacetate hydrolase family protein [Geomicrobium sediminis]MBM7633206.1 2-keto-4-pentenoate hydratase/2-oxohepta-3-ene-1,7-dioic acid hydratase in catechol pathway [Geomicrobium sediminis]
MDVLAKLKTSEAFIRFTRSEYIDVDLIDLPIAQSIYRITLDPKDHDRHNNPKVTLHEIPGEQCIAHREKVTIPMNETELLSRPGIGIVFDHEPKHRSKKALRESLLGATIVNEFHHPTHSPQQYSTTFHACSIGPWISLEQMNFNHSTVYTYRNKQHMLTWHPAEMIDDILTVLGQVTKQTHIKHGDLVMLTSDSYASPCGVLDTIDVTIDGIGTLQNSFQFLARRTSENRHRTEYSEQ